MAIRRVWVEEGCISCNLCEDLCPEVFEVLAGQESQTRRGHERRLGETEVQDKVREASESCPVEVIQVEEG